MPRQLLRQSKNVEKTVNFIEKRLSFFKDEVKVRLEIVYQFLSERLAYARDLTSYQSICPHTN